MLPLLQSQRQIRTILLTSFLLPVFTVFLSAASATKNAPLPPELYAVGGDSRQTTDITGFQIVSDPETRIEAVAILCPFSDDVFLSELAKNLRRDIKIVALVQSTETAGEIWENLTNAKIPHLRERLRFVIVRSTGRISRWGRDPYIVLRNEANSSYALVGALQKGDPRVDKWDDRWVRSALTENNFGISNILVGNFARLSTWLLEGGAITSDDKYVYTGEGTVELMTRDLQGKGLYTSDAVAKEIERIVGKKLIILPSQDLHSDRFHIPVGRTKFGEHTSVLADPMRALEIISTLTENEKKQALKTIQNYGLTWQNESYIETEKGRNLMARLLQRLNKDSLENLLGVSQDEIEYIRQSINTRNRNLAEKVLKDNGIAVVRIPILNREYIFKEIIGDSPNEQEKSKTIRFPLSLAYTNIIQDYDGRHHVAYIPKYGIKKLDDEVLRIYKSLGKFDKIYQIPSVREGVGDGGPRCRMQVLGRPIKKSKKD